MRNQNPEGQIPRSKTNYSSRPRNTYWENWKKAEGSISESRQRKSPRKEEIMGEGMGGISRETKKC